MPGPDPKPNRVRRNTPVKEQVRALLPREGRSGRPPAIPPWAPGDEWLEQLWAKWWTSPQATQWDATIHTATLGRLLLLYVDDPKSAEARQIEKEMGLTPKSMKDLGWKVADDEVGERRSEREEAKPARKLRAVDPAVS